MTKRSLARSLVLVLLVAALVPGAPARHASAAPAAATCVSSEGPGIPPPAAMPAKAPGWHAGWYGQSGYMSLCPGHKATATVAYYNVGSFGWVRGRMGEMAFLGTWGPEPGQDQASALGGDGTNGSPATGWPSHTRISAQPADYVAPGQVAWFQFTVQAPQEPGVYVVGLRPLIEGAQWMEDIGVFWVVTVLNPDGSKPGPSQRPACKACWPLTGMPLAPGAPVQRRTINVKIDNAPQARPHSGTTAADIIFETVVEGLVTRYAAMYHSQEPAVVGSIRSGRLSDRYLTTMVQGAVAYSGATNEETWYFEQDARNGHYFDLNANWAHSSAAYYRVSNRPSPYNMYSSIPRLREALARAGGSDPVWVPQWKFLESATHIAWAGGMWGGAPATHITVPYRADRALVRYEYDPGSKTYARWQNDARGVAIREVDAMNGQPTASRNIVIINTDIWETDIIQDIFGSRGYDMRLTGTGFASIFRDGLRQDGTWSRPTHNEAFTFTSYYGEQILLSPGQTWVHIVPADWGITSR